MSADGSGEGLALGRVSFRKTYKGDDLAGTGLTGTMEIRHETASAPS